MNKVKRIAKILLILVGVLMASYWTTDHVFAACSASITASGAVNIGISIASHAGIATDGVTVETDCEGGYSISIGGSTADNTLYLGGDNTSTAMISASAGTKNNPSAIFTTGENIYANTWGYSTVAGTTITSATFVGLTNQLVEIFNKNAPSEVGGDTYTIYYGASVSIAQTAGTYMMANDAKVVYYMVARPLGFEVTGNPTEWTKQDVTLTVVPEDASEVAGYSFDGGETWQASPSKVYAENTSGIEVAIKNHEGTVSPIKIVNITKIDKSAPTIAFDNSTEYNSDHTTKQVTTLIATLNENKSISSGMTVTDGLSGVASGWPKCYRNDVEITSTNTFTNVGRYAITCRAQDNLGNEAEENREVLIRWPTAGKYIVAKTTLDGAGIAGTGLSTSTSSDGLYKDNASTGANVALPFASKYYYTGPVVDNYLDFAGTTFRVLNVATNDTIKVLGDLSDTKVRWGPSYETDNRKIYLSNTYNTWSTKWWPRGQIYNNETGEGKYKLFTETEKNHLALATFYAGRFNKSDAVDISYTVYYEQTGNVNLGGDDNPAFEGYSAYPNVSDYLKASKAHDYVINIDDTQDNGVLGIGTTKRDVFNSNSWIDMSEDQWTMNSKNLTSTDNDFWVLDGTLHGRIISRTFYYEQQYRVVFYLTDTTILSGDGSSASPYTVEEDWAWFDSAQVLQ